MSETNDYQKLAIRLLDLWQEQMTLVAQDPEYQVIFKNWQDRFNSFATADGPSFPFPGQGLTYERNSTAFQQPAGAGKENGAPPPTAASNSRDDTLRELARTLEMLNQRLDRLEQRDDPSKPSGSG
ncbi:hypothetical protein [Aestuariispira insulae]|uniref:Uncharacterized protein n=1 Tax=Aestuariispira insulae TaxID=1461337 RepID=A0A3D9HX20_9PROT|nr:hypothetical protein [Aestuariispira insulae]RED54052.1 hypothetical protein DFP90_101853 [Aestuariispira insulae]